MDGWVLWNVVFFFFLTTIVCCDGGSGGITINGHILAIGPNQTQTWILVVSYGNFFFFCRSIISQQTRWERDYHHHHHSCRLVVGRRRGPRQKTFRNQTKKQIDLNFKSCMFFFQKKKKRMLWPCFLVCVYMSIDQMHIYTCEYNFFFAFLILFSLNLIIHSDSVIQQVHIDICCVFFFSLPLWTYVSVIFVCF